MIGRFARSASSFRLACGRRATHGHAQPPPRKRAAVTRGEGGEGGAWRAGGAHRLAVKDVAERPEQLGEGVAVEAHAHDVAGGGDGRHTRLRLEQRHLAEVVAARQLVLDRLDARRALLRLRHPHRARLDDVEVVALLALRDDVLAVLKLDLGQRVDQRLLLGRREALEHFHAAEHLRTAAGGIAASTRTGRARGEPNCTTARSA